MIKENSNLVENNQRNEISEIILNGEPMNKGIKNNNENQSTNDPLLKTLDKNIQSTIGILIISWLMSGALMNVTNKNLNYLTLEYSSSYMALPHIIMTLLIALIGLYFFKDHINELLSLSFSLFFISLLNFALEDTVVLGIILLLSFSLILNLLGVFSKNKKGMYPAILLTIINFIGLSLYLMRINLTRIGQLIRLDTPSFKNNPRLGTYIIYISLFFLVLTLFILYKYKERLDKKNIILITILILAVIGQAYAVGRILFSRYSGLRTSTYDFNLFAQMFYSMSKGLGPLTTLERNMPLSHFNVHISPSYYLMLPFYMISKDPGSLQILQAIIVASGAIPLFLIGKHFNFNKKTLALITVVYMVNPAMILSSFYDLHENCMLAPFILWLFYAIEKNNKVLMIIFTLLTLGIKEDASIYIWTIALYLILDRKMVVEGLAMFISSGAYFLYCLKSLNQGGQGAMLGRFDNFVSNKELSILSVPITALKNPGFFFYTIFKGHKISYLFKMLLPISFAPFLNKRYTRLILFIPLLVINLLPDYIYQANIMFQYNYGSMAFLLYFMLLILNDLKNLTKEDEEVSSNKNDFKREKFYFNNKFKKIIINSLLVLSIVFGLSYSIPYTLNYNFYVEGYKKDYKTTSKLKSELDKIPEEASVLSSSFLTGYLSKRENIYDIEHNIKEGDFFKADYIIMDLRNGFNKNDGEYKALFLKNGYKVSWEVDNIVRILVKK